MAAVSILMVINGRFNATTMRIKGTSGKVSLFTRDDHERSIKEELRLQSGNKLLTGEDSEADIALDDTKLAVVKENSRVHFEQHSKKLKISIDEGSLFFHVSKKLANDEEFNIISSVHSDKRIIDSLKILLVKIEGS